MSDLSSAEKRKLERLFEMGSGYVLDFSHRTLADFIEEHTGRDVYAESYPQRGSGSKAWRVRAVWEVEPNHVVGKLIAALIEHRAEVLREQEANGSAFAEVTRQPDEDRLVSECGAIVARLMRGCVVQELDAIRAPAGAPDFETIAKEVHEAIRRNAPETGLDRLHTFLVKFVRLRCAARSITETRDRPLHSVFGEYAKALRKEGRVESQMTERILKSTISTLEAFNEVRNERSLAHDNPILTHAESLFIFNHVTALVRFLTAIDAPGTDAAPNEPPQAPSGGDPPDIPF